MKIPGHYPDLSGSSVPVTFLLARPRHAYGAGAGPSSFSVRVMTLQVMLSLSALDDPAGIGGHAPHPPLRPAGHFQPPACAGRRPRRSGALSIFPLKARTSRPLKRRRSKPVMIPFVSLMDDDKFACLVRRHCQICSHFR